MKNLNRRKFITSSTVASAGMGLLGSPNVFAATGNSNVAKKPHIILIMTDQHRADALGCMGNRTIKTPHIDSIAFNGACFANGFSSTPSCTPARAGLLTGMSPWNHGMLGYGRVARKYKYEMPQMLRNLGYHTFGIGKMHWFPPKSLHGFHGTLVEEASRKEQDGFVSDYIDWFKLEAPGEDPDKTGIGPNEHRSGVYQLEERLHPTHWTGETAARFIQNYKPGKPLFLKVSFTRPHSPYDPPQRYLDMYNGAGIPGPSVGDWAKRFADFPKTSDAAFGDYGMEYAVNSRRHYYASISFVDDQVGKILQALKDQNMYEDALICFISDHGDMLGDHHHWRKTYAYQGSAKIPFLLSWPQSWKNTINRGGVVNHPVELRDVLPTFLDAAEGRIPGDMDGKSLLQLVRNEKPDWRKYIDLEHAASYTNENYWCALTDGKIKYIWFFITGEEQLFDLAVDPGEVKNLSSDKDQTTTLELWRSKMVSHLRNRGESFVKEGKLQVRKEPMLYSPNYPGDAFTEGELLRIWSEESNFLN